ncbi:MAG TPA: c-type cytochrome [Candidatus Avalokitesvara rifleensis]|uniref:c-type cytochrome n=1 Tax=Candidatus Avalokitesvara rifleensis TaxID=3367620 RepID=UPI0027126F73|nr:cytochrome c [Candidatus Brocadiales bacterium]
MGILSWLAVFSGVALCILFTYGLLRIEDMGQKTLKRIFILGTLLFSTLFLIFTFNTLSVIPHRTNALKITKEVEEGKKVWHKYVCINCHTLLGNGAYYAPDLTRAWDRFLDRTEGDEDAAEAAMATFLKHPPRPAPGRRGMPAFHLEDEETKNVTVFLRWVSHIDTNGWPPKPIALVSRAQRPQNPSANNTSYFEQALVTAGERLFVSKGCSICHTMGKGNLVGPDLSGIVPRHGFDFLVRWLQDPESVYAELGIKPINQGFPPMPAMNVSREEAASIATFLLNLSEGGTKWGS